ncbi:MAG: mandelate racemase [Rhodospirillaceae bacterium]|nr:mandelate racemase [Rhodospirillaceae bacterium]MBT5193796.1 mandelate racemase [Rhodospirillaceae bacterium]MBT5897193.1 mandelate racemase [Rhodospirillaceae bacterium]MBT6427558.1 mandelate racemase [Rhodospirillaceae bacterium]MBT7758626.1 mandelate racemase [Rhodospirillaceae bacterium]
MSEPIKLSLLEVQLYERDVSLRMPFRFGVTTLRESPQVFAKVRIRLADGREGWGLSAEVLAPKWFDKNLDLSNEDNFNQLRHALTTASGLYRATGPKTAFGLFRSNYDEQVRICGERGDNSLVACYGPAVLDRAILDALCRLQGVSFYTAIQGNLPGIESDEFHMDRFLKSLRPAATIHARHTVGMVDPIRENPEPVGDGLPETLQDVIAAYGHRYFKIKVCGDLDEDVARLVEIADVLDEGADDYIISLDGNEQYNDVAGVAALLDGIEGDKRLARFNQSILFVEQPISRAVALDVDVSTLSARKPVILDESDGFLGAFPKGRELGYRGVSSKTCKGLYKSILNRGRCAHWGDGYFMSAEDLTTQAGLAVQQDLALVNLLGITHVERNGHHYVNGLAGVPEAEQTAFRTAHPDMYHQADGVTRLTIKDGQIALGSLDAVGYAYGAEPDFSPMRELHHG